MGVRRTEKTEQCGIKDCTAEAVRSLPAKKVVEAMKEKEVKDKDAKRIHLCREHYRAFKKLTKTDRELDRLGWM
ncbi:MAG: hypothetical protein QW728_01705 [Thermoplasmata archaeon]